jgi:hypothetical protein
MNLPNYHYRPLEIDHIRLLHIEAPELYMEHISIYSLPRLAFPEAMRLGRRSGLEYLALSYTWGDCSETVPLECEGMNLPVRKNLHKALSLFRYPNFRPKLTMPIWIDAICINQDDEVEKLRQIQLMARIFQGARTVWVCVLFIRALIYCTKDWHTRSGLETQFLRCGA